MSDAESRARSCSLLGEARDSYGWDEFVWKKSCAGGFCPEAHGAGVYNYIILPPCSIHFSSVSKCSSSLRQSPGGFGNRAIFLCMYCHSFLKFSIKGMRPCSYLYIWLFSGGLECSLREFVAWATINLQFSSWITPIQCLIYAWVSNPCPVIAVKDSVGTW